MSCNNIDNLKSRLIVVRMAIALFFVGYYAVSVSGWENNGTGWFTQQTNSPVYHCDSSPDSLVIRGGSNDLSRLPIVPFRGRTVLRAFGEWDYLNSKETTGLASGFRTENYGGGIGCDWSFGSNAVFGGEIDFTQIAIKPVDTRLAGNTSTLSGVAHIAVFGELWYTNMALGVGRHWSVDKMDTDDDLFENKFQSTQWNYEIDFGLRVKTGFTRIEPLVGFRYTNLVEPGTANIFPGSGVTIRASNKLNSYRFIAGSRFLREYTGHLAKISPSLSVSWVHEFGDESLFITSELSSFPVVRRFGENKMGRDRLQAGAEVTFALRDSVDIFFFYQSVFAKNYAGYSIFGGLNKKF